MKLRNLATLVTALAAAAALTSCTRPVKPVDPASIKQMEVNIAYFVETLPETTNLVNLKPSAATNFESSGIHYVVQFYEEPEKCTALIYHDHSQSTNKVTMYTQVISSNAFDAKPLTNDAYIFNSQANLLPNFGTVGMNLSVVPSGTLNHAFVFSDQDGKSQILEIWRTNGVKMHTYQTNLPQSDPLYFFIIPEQQKPQPKPREKNTLI